ncbi:MAG TPA: thioredoxin fold domain-containing protein [Chthonomonadaceae bacterium]|nr:thioredoxin fold domain-containing protein [Chthonomonadaceae bacterium]
MRTNPRGRVKGWLLLTTLFLGAGALGAIRESHFRTDIAWSRSFEAGLAQARRNREPLLISFQAPDCGWCEKLDAETFTDPQMIEMSRHFVCVRVDSEVDPAIVARYAVAAFPTTLLLDPQGRVLARIPGYLPADRFAPWLRAALSAGARRP